MLKECWKKIVAKKEERKAKVEEARRKREQEEDEELSRMLNERMRACGLPERDYASIFAKSRNK